MEPPKKLLTRPTGEEDCTPYATAGSPWVTLPMVGASGGVYRAGFLAEKEEGLLEWSGSPLFQPLRRDAQDWRLCETRGAGLLYASGSGKEEVRLDLFCPRSHPAVVFRFHCAQRADARAQLLMRPQALLGTVFNTYPVAPKLEVFLDPWTESLVVYAPGPRWAFAVAGEGKTTFQKVRGGFRLSQPLVGGGKTAFHIAFCRHPDGARTKTVHLRRVGAKVLLEALEAENEKMEARFRMTAEFAPLFYRNLHFARDFACGRTLDTGRPRLLTSRSPLYYVSGAFWARDAFYWSYPILARSDPETAREALLSVLAKYGTSVADHALYLDGRPLYPGFELDQLAAPLHALQTYVEATGERAIASDPAVKSFLRGFEAELMRWKHPRRTLFATFLNASDDPATHPYVCTANVLIWRGLSHLHQLTGKEKYRRLAAALRADVNRSMCGQGPFGPMWACAAGAEGNLLLGDEPPASLLLLPCWGFSAKDDVRYRNTVRFIYSRHNPYRFEKVRFPGVGCEHVPYPTVFGLCNALMAGVQLDEVSDVLRRAPLDNGLACESFNPRTGQVKTGRHFAAAAGFLCQALLRRFGEARGRGNRRSKLA